MKSLMLCLLAASVTLVAFSDQSFADSYSSRKGIIVGGGVGPGLASLSGDDNTVKLGLSTDLTIGYGLTDKLLVYAMSRIVWFSLDGELTFSENAGVGVSYFLSNSVPSIYVAGGVGAAVFVQPGTNSDNQFGPAGLVGVGYEFKQHLLLGVDASYGRPGDMDSTTVLAKLSYLFY